MKMILLLCLSLGALAAEYRVVAINRGNRPLTGQPVLAQLPMAELDAGGAVSVTGPDGPVTAQFAWDLRADGSLGPVGVLWLADFAPGAWQSWKLGITPGTAPAPAAAPPLVEAGHLRVQPGGDAYVLGGAAWLDDAAGEWPFCGPVVAHGPGGDLAGFKGFRAAYRFADGPVAPTLIKGDRDPALDVAWAQVVRLWPARGQLECVTVLRNLADVPAQLGQMVTFDTRPAPGGALATSKSPNGDDVVYWRERGHTDHETPVTVAMPRMTVMWAWPASLHWVDRAADGPNRSVWTAWRLPGCAPQVILYDLRWNTDIESPYNCRWLTIPGAGREYPVIPPRGEFRVSLWWAVGGEAPEFPEFDAVEVTLLPQ